MKRYLLLIFLLSIYYNGYGQPAFNALAGPTGGNFKLIQKTSTNKLFALTEKAVYESTSNGNAWTKTIFGVQNDVPASLYIDNADKIYIATNQKIYKSTDLGGTWTSVTATGVWNPSKDLQKNHATGSLYIIGYNGTFYGVQKSTDDGATWFDFSPESGQINQLVVNNFVFPSQILAAANSSVMYRSINDTGWATSGTGLPAGIPFSAEPGIVVNKFNGKIYCIPQTGLYESSNNGANWSLVSLGSTIPFDQNQRHGIFASQSSSTIYVHVNNNLYSKGTPVTSSSAWTQVSLGNSDAIGSMLIFSSNVFVGLRNDFREADGILRSTNSGSTWAYADGGIFEYKTSSMMRANDGRLMAINGGGTITRSTDDGASWTKTKLCDCGFFNFIKRANGNIVAIGDRTYLSTDNGANWNPLGSPHANFLSRLVSGDAGATVYGIGGTTIYKSTNGGQLFTALTITGFTGTPEKWGLAADNANNLFAYVDPGKVYRILGPSNTSAVEITNSGITLVRGIYTVGANFYILGEVGGGSRLAKSANQGTSWTTQIIDGSAELSMVSDNIIFARNFDDEISFSNDAGVDWNVAYDPGIGFLGLVGATVDNNGIAYVSTSQGAMRKSAASVVPPNKPTNLKTIARADKMVHLEWDNITTGGANVDTYIIERKLTVGGTYEVIGEAGGSEFYYRDGTTVKNTGYDYRVIADSDAGSKTSDPISITTKDDCPLALPDNRSWSGVVTPGPFNVNPVVIRKISSDYYSISEFTAGSLVGVAKIGGGTYGSAAVETFFNDACGTPFIEVKNDVFPNGNGTWNGSNIITLNFQLNKGKYADTEKTITLTLNAVDPAPEVPSDLSAYVVNDTQIRIQWAAGDFQKKYIVERSLTTSTGFSQVGMVDYPTLSFTDSGPFVAGTTYFYRVKAQNNKTPTPDESAYSGETSIVFNKPIFVLSNTIVSSTFASAPSAAWGDLDDDGFQDLVMPILNLNETVLVEPYLFKNNAGADFQLLTGKLPAGKNLITPAIADYNNDGKLDVFITAAAFEGSGSTGLKNVLLKNDGNFDFTSIDNSVTLDQASGQSTFTSNWVDVNSNGLLDLFIPYQDANGQKLFTGNTNGVFTENTVAGGLITDSFSKGPAFWADYDNDGDQDVFILSNSDSNPNRLYNNSAGVLTRVSPAVFDTHLGAFFTASWGDYNNDQFVDLFVGDQEGGKNYLYKNNGDGTFTKIADTPNSPSENTASSNAGSAWGDVDNDGDLDLLVASVGEPNLFYLNQGNGTFTKVTNEIIAGYNTAFNLGTAFADYNNDGHLDVVVGALNFPLGGGESDVSGDDPQIKLYKNNLTSGNWIKIKLNGAAGPQSALSNRSAIGARLKIVAGGKTQVRDISSLTGFGSQNSLIVHFGLGAETTITTLDVKFPSGTLKTLTNVAANQLLVIDEDGEGPQISTFTPKNRDKGFASEEISVSANDAVSVASFNLFHRPISSKDFVPTALAKVGATNEWKVNVLESWYDDMGVEFYFEAADPFGNKTRNPVVGTNYYSYFNNKEANAPKFPTTSLVFGGTDKTWNIVSIPFDLGTSATVTSVLDELGVFDDTQWRLLTYQNQTAWAEFPSNFSSFTRGKGYFLNVKTPPSAGITIASEILSPQNNQSTLFTLDLAAGWNQIGNPYLVPVNWTDVKAFNSVAGVGDLKVYNSNALSYGDGNILEVYKGGFVFANQAVTGYKISFSGQTAGGRKRGEGRIAGSELDNTNWRTMLTLHQSDVTFKLGGVGMHPEANLSYDDFDDVTLPRLANFLEMNFHHPEHFAKQFSRDVVPTQNEYTWEFTVDSNLKGTATFAWDNTKFGDNEKELFLFDLGQQKPIDMRELNSYTFEPASSNRFRIYFGESLRAKIQPEKILLGKAYPNPASHITTIPFTLPQASGSYQVRLEVYDMMGKRVSVLQQGLLPAGFYESQWDTSKDQLVNGLYTYRLVVSGDRKNEVYSNKIILNK